MYLVKNSFRNYLNVINLIVLPSVFFILNRGRAADDQATLLMISLPMILLASVIFNFGGTIKSYREHGFFIKYKLLGMKPWEVTLGVFVYTLIIQLLSIFLMVVLGGVFFGVVIDLHFLYVLGLFIVMINLLQFSLVFLATALPVSSTNFTTISQILFFYQLFLGLYLTDQILNNQLLAYFAALLNPVSSVFKVGASIFMNNQSLKDFPLEIISVLLLSSGFIYFGNKYFKWESTNK